MQNENSNEIPFLPKDWRKLQSLIFWQWSGEIEAHIQLVGMSNGAAAMKNSMAVPSKIKNKIIIQSNNSTSGHIQKN